VQVALDMTIRCKRPDRENVQEYLIVFQAFSSEERLKMTSD